MQAATTNRWGLGFIAWRWRHAFWLLPLLGLLLGLGLQFWKLCGPTATGLIQVSPLWLTPARTCPAEVSNLLLSENVLSRTAASLNRSGRWAIDPGMGVTKLRGMIHSEVVPGTLLIELRVSGSTRSEAIEIWNTLVRLVSHQFIDPAQVVTDATLEAENVTIQDLHEKQRKLTSALRQMIRANTAPDSSDQNNLIELQQLRAELHAAEKSYNKGMSRRAPTSIACVTPIAPVIIREAPPVLSLNRWESIRPIVIHASAGFSIGVVAMTPVAYLLELLRPRRREVVRIEVSSA